MITDLEQLSKELQLELTNILHYWMHNTIDEKYGGFYGKIDNENIVDNNAPRGLVLNARILWTFSAAYNYTKEKKYLAIADRSYRYLIDHFLDKQYGGFYWSVDKHGESIDNKKQVYGIAFCLYGFSEYYKACNNEEVLRQAEDCYALIEQYSFDEEKGGYLEAFTRNWQPTDDLRLSEKDANEKKTMNTQLHVLEAYTNLYRVWKNRSLENSIRLLLENFVDYIINTETGHLHLFFDENWLVKSDTISYGHDVEAAWLLHEAAEATDDKTLIKDIKNISVKLAAAAVAGLDSDGGLWYETAHGSLVNQKHWWPQAEALVGFFNAWQLTQDEAYLRYVTDNWRFIKARMINEKKGEWFWGINGDHTIMDGQDKAGFWKCPYHNARACIEINKRIQAIK